ncbi:MAG: DNA mismatch endonuclease Vsr [Nocardioidaceae bacterium]
MSRMPRRDTKPELELRRELHRRGLRFRVQAALPGRPDIAFTRARLAVFVDGCFWHACPQHGTVPKNNREWWTAKLGANVARDRAKDEQLAALGWQVLHVWEHDGVALAADQVEARWRSLTVRAPSRRLSDRCENLVIVEPWSQSEVSNVRSRRSSLAPSAARLTTSLRDIGYNFPAAVADLVDNSVSAGARRVDVEIEFDSEDSRVFVADDGCGMSTYGVLEAMRFGSRRVYHDEKDLGRYGLGLKTASLSQARRLTVVSRRQALTQRTAVRTLDLDLIVELDDWVVIDPGRTEVVERAKGMLSEDEGGTVVVWENLDRLLPERSPDGGWARRRIASMTVKTSEHLAMVFHRFLAADSGEPLVITVNGEKLMPWDPFATSETATQALPRRTFEIVVGTHQGLVTLQRFVLPSRDAFSSAAEFDRHSGPLKWNRQQGLYIYRANRLVQWGGWAGIRGIDEHTKLGRAALDFSTDLDTVFQVNVAKMRVTIPSQLRPMLERPVTELCLRADDAYRKTSKSVGAGVAAPRSESSAERQLYGLALRTAAAQSGEYAAFKKIVDVLRHTAPGIVTDLGLG